MGNQFNNLYMKYDNIILIGDLNSEMSEETMKNFSITYNLECLIHVPTCFKNVENPSCIDLILTNKPLLFQNTSIIETGISDFHNLTLATMTFNFQKQEPKILNYRNYKFFNNENFRTDLLYEISKFGFYNISCEQFESLFMVTLREWTKFTEQRGRAMEILN